jgi:hypothetical protein
MYRSFFHAANSHLRHLLQDAVQTLIPEERHLQASVAHPLRVVVLHQRTMVEAIGTSTPTDLGRSHALVPQNATAHGRDPFHLDPDLPREDVVADEIVLVEILAEDEEVQVIAATVVMMTGAGAEVVDEEDKEDEAEEAEEEDVMTDFDELGGSLYSDGVWKGWENCTN